VKAALLYCMNNTRRIGASGRAVEGASGRAVEGASGRAVEDDIHGENSHEIEESDNPISLFDENDMKFIIKNIEHYVKMHMISKTIDGELPSNLFIKNCEDPNIDLHKYFDYKIKINFTKLFVEKLISKADQRFCNIIDEIQIIHETNEFNNFNKHRDFNIVNNARQNIQLQFIKLYCHLNFKDFKNEEVKSHLANLVVLKTETFNVKELDINESTIVDMFDVYVEECKHIEKNHYIKVIEYLKKVKDFKEYKELEFDDKNQQNKKFISLEQFNCGVVKYSDIDDVIKTFNEHAEKIISDENYAKKYLYKKFINQLRINKTVWKYDKLKTTTHDNKIVITDFIKTTFEQLFEHKYCKISHESMKKDNNTSFKKSRDGVISANSLLNFQKRWGKEQNTVLSRNFESDYVELDCESFDYDNYNGCHDTENINVFFSEVSSISLNKIIPLHLLKMYNNLYKKKIRYDTFEYIITNTHKIVSNIIKDLIQYTLKYFDYNSNDLFMATHVYNDNVNIYNTYHRYYKDIKKTNREKFINKYSRLLEKKNLSDEEKIKLNVMTNLQKHGKLRQNMSVFIKF
jgi:hypothetical protein